MKKILIWMPLSESAEWRGEGIAQVVENIIFNADSNLSFDIFTSKNAAAQISDALSEFDTRANIRFLNGVKKKKKKEIILDLDSLKKSYLAELAELLKDKLNQGLAKYFRFGFALIFSSIQIRRISNYDGVWVPTPLFKIKTWKKFSHKIVYNFWDPFGFEYSFFPYTTKLYFYKRLSEIKKDGYKIITQSTHNKNYLINVLKFDNDRIKVIRCGNYVKPYSDSQANHNKISIRDYPSRFSYTSLSSRAIVQELDNRSIVARLEARLREKTKIIFISTQNRPYKGLHRFLSIFSQILNNNDVVILTTADISELILEKFPSLTEAVYILKRVSNKQHSYLFSVCDLFVHPSYVEGGVGAFSMFEAALNNKPALVNWGRHVREFNAIYGKSIDVGLISVNFDESEKAIYLINELLNNPSVIEKNIAEIKKSISSWVDTSNEYIKVLSSD